MLSRVLEVSGWVVAAPATIVVLARLCRLAETAPVAVLLAVLTPWTLLVVLGALLASTAALVLRPTATSAALLVLTLALVAVHVAWVAPTFTRRAGPAAASGPDATRLRVLAVNVLFTNPRGDLVAAEVARLRPDVIIVSEASPVSLPPLLADPALAAYPHRLLAPTGASGAALLSRLPLVDAQIWDCAGQPMARAGVVLPGGRVLRLYQAHPAAPAEDPQARRWQRQMRALSAAVRAELAAGRDVVVAGDLNSSRDTRPFTGLLDTGLTDASDGLGRGPWHATWKVGGRLPRLLRLDHVLVSAAVAVSAAGETRSVGSDHLGVTADLALPQG